jgi:hypothetical protein
MSEGEVEVSADEFLERHSRLIIRMLELSKTKKDKSSSEYFELVTQFLHIYEIFKRIKQKELDCLKR